jgi:hypothetical protein
MSTRIAPPQTASITGAPAEAVVKFAEQIARNRENLVRHGHGTISFSTLTSEIAPCFGRRARNGTRGNVGVMRATTV